MPQSLSKVYIHAIFSTKHRMNLIDENIQSELFNYLGGVCKGLECNPVQIGGYFDHIHLLCILSRKIPQMKFIEEVKKSSSKWIKTKGEEYSDFYWQNGYGIFSVSPLNVEKAAEYIRNQKIHHQNLTFKQEYRKFLRSYGVNYDEKYIWD